MKGIFSNKKEYVKDIIIILISFVVTYLLHMYNDNLYHSIIELVTIVIGCSLAIISAGTYKISDNHLFSFLGIVYGFISVLDLFHILTYHGILILNDGMNISIQIRMVARLYESIVLIISLYITNYRVSLKKIFLINLSVVILALSYALVGKIPVTLYIEGQGITQVKIYFEVVICLIFIVFVLLLKKKSKKISVERTNLLLLAAIFKIISEVFFSVYTNLNDLYNFLAHFAKFISFYYLFKILIYSVILDPYSAIFKKLNTKAIELQMKNIELSTTKYKIEKDYLENKRLIEFLPDGIVIRENEKIVYVNDRFCKIIGISDKSQIINKTMYDIMDESYHTKLNERINNTCKEGLITPEEYELFFNNKKVYVEISSIYSESITEKPSIVSVIRDISDRKKAEEIEILLKEKEKEDIIKNEFFANISHELRTPINVIYSAIQLETNCIENLSAEQLVKYNDTIKKNCLRLIRIINNIIDITRIETGFFKPEFRIENIVALVEDITLSIVTYAEAKKIKVVFDTEYEELYVSCDSNLIERIILNLLSNSVKYGKENGSIEVYVYKKNDYSVSISVKDDGIGIPEDMQQKIFERFQKVDKSMSRSSEGSGIGLSLVKSLVEIQNGTIEINSKINEGTEFIVNFPLIVVNDEVSATLEGKAEDEEKEIEEKAKIEFSDIYN